MVSGALPATHGPLVFHYWKSPGAFNNGLKGICKALLQAAFSCTSGKFSYSRVVKETCSL